MDIWIDISSVTPEAKQLWAADDELEAAGLLRDETAAPNRQTDAIEEGKLAGELVIGLESI